MSAKDDKLGGRIPLLEPGELSTAQKEVYDRLNAGMIQWAHGVPFRADTPDGRFIGPFNPMLLSPEITSGFLDFIASVPKWSTLDPRLSEVVTLSVGAVWKSAYELYAHSAAGRKAGLPDEAVRELAAGGCPDELTPQEKLAHQFTRQLITGYRVDDAVFREAGQELGKQGLMDLTYLIGWYLTVCALLNAFDVPAPGD